MRNQNPQMSTDESKDTRPLLRKPTEAELEFLRGYTSGPRIWDAASLQPMVHTLAEQRLIKAADGHPGAYQLTSRGIWWLREAAARRFENEAVSTCPVPMDGWTDPDEPSNG